MLPWSCNCMTVTECNTLNHPPPPPQHAWQYRFIRGLQPGALCKLEPLYCWVIGLKSLLTLPNQLSESSLWLSRQTYNWTFWNYGLLCEPRMDHLVSTRLHSVIIYTEFGCKIKGCSHRLISQPPLAYFFTDSDVCSCSAPSSHPEKHHI